MEFKNLMELYTALKEYDKEKDLYAMALNVNCDSRRYTGKLVNKSYIQLKKLLDKNNMDIVRLRKMLEE